MTNVVQLKPKVANADTVWLSPEQVCERVPGMTLKRLADLREAKKGPDYFKPSLKTVIYSQAEIDAWVERTRVRSTGS